jgi:hypothetical protein
VPTCQNEEFYTNTIMIRKLRRARQRGFQIHGYKNKEHQNDLSLFLKHNKSSKGKKSGKSLFFSM